MDKCCQRRLCQFHHKIITPDCGVPVKMLFVFAASSTHDLLRENRSVAFWSNNLIRILDTPQGVKKIPRHFDAVENIEGTGKYPKGRSDDLNL